MPLPLILFVAHLCFWLSHSFAWVFFPLWQNNLVDLLPTAMKFNAGRADRFLRRTLTFSLLKGQNRFIQIKFLHCAKKKRTHLLCHLISLSWVRFPTCSARRLTFSSLLSRRELTHVWPVLSVLLCELQNRVKGSFSFFTDHFFSVSSPVRVRERNK